MSYLTEKFTESGLHYFERTESQRAVVILAINEDSRLVLLEQDRPVVDARLIEWPAGTVEPGEDPEAAARRELLEETGYEAVKIVRVLDTVFEPGCFNQYVRFYAATCRRVGEPTHPDTGNTKIHTVAYNRLEKHIEEWTQAGLAIDGKVWLYWAVRRIADQQGVYL